MSEPTLAERLAEKLKSTMRWDVYGNIDFAGWSKEATPLIQSALDEQARVSREGLLGLMIHNDGTTGRGAYPLHIYLPRRDGGYDGALRYTGSDDYQFQNMETIIAAVALAEGEGKLGLRTEDAQ